MPVVAESTGGSRRAAGGKADGWCTSPPVSLMCSVSSETCCDGMIAGELDVLATRFALGPLKKFEKALSVDCFFVAESAFGFRVIASWARHLSLP